MKSSLWEPKPICHIPCHVSDNTSLVSKEHKDILGVDNLFKRCHLEEY